MTLLDAKTFRLVNKYKLQLWQNGITMGKPKYREDKPIPLPLCPSQIPQGLVSD